MTYSRAMQFLRYHGVVLESARGFEPSIAQLIAGEMIKGSWWNHPKAKQIYEITQCIRISKVVLVCSLAAGKITYIHRRLWPYFARTAQSFPVHALDQVQEIHLPSGRHRRRDVPFFEWLTQEAACVTQQLSIKEASSEVAIWLDRYGIA